MEPAATWRLGAQVRAIPPHLSGAWRSFATVSFADFAAFRRTLPPPAPLARTTRRVRGLTFACYHTPPVAGAAPLVCTNGGLIYDHRLLWPALSPLAVQRQVWCWDQRGRGRTPAPPGAHAARFTHDIGDLAALLERLASDSGRPVDAFGHSWGTGLTLAAAAQVPHAVRRVVLANCVGPTGAWRPTLLANARARLDPVRRATFDSALAALAHDSSIAAHSDYSRALYPAWFVDPAFADVFQPPVATSDTGAAVATHLYRDGYDITDIVRGFSRPTLFVLGADDALPPAEGRATAALVTQPHEVTLAHCGHLPFWERPQPFFETVEAFLSAPEPHA
jgi:proline iminopeptidase